ncbi:MAG TPA: hydrogenase maturation protease, partial [Nitrososphaerales archaeon]|nr:hydrogenase maturation protease [Nitrososphaerales archaeon]
MGTGNPIKSDDSVGLHIISKLHDKYGTAPRKFVKIAHAKSLEASLAQLTQNSRADITDLVVIFDAIESNIPSGSILFANLARTKYGLFATHNLPLKLIPSVANNIENVFVLGVQTETVGIGEELSACVRNSAELIIDKVSNLIEA